MQIKLRVVFICIFILLTIGILFYFNKSQILNLRGNNLSSSKYGIERFIEENRVIGKKGVLYPFSILEEKGPSWTDYIVKGIVIKLPYKDTDGLYKFEVESTFSNDQNPVRLNILMGSNDFDPLVYFSPSTGLEVRQEFKSTMLSDLVNKISIGKEIQVNLTTNYSQSTVNCQGRCKIFTDLILKYGANSQEYFSSKGSSGKPVNLGVASKYIVIN